MEKYDRQMRLWGQEGQEKLKESKVLVINLCGSSCEALKNLVLAGIGHFLLIDD